MVVLVAPLLTAAVVGPYGRIDKPPISEPQRWTLDADSMDRAISPTGLDVIAAVDVGNGRVVNIAGAIGGGGSRARVAPPEDAGTKTGQTRTVKAGIDGGCIRAHFKWKTREAKWALDGASVEWSLDKATSSEADALRRTVAAIKRERERDPVASGDAYVRPEEAFARELGFIDDDIGETERRIAESSGQTGPSACPTGRRRWRARPRRRRPRPRCALASTRSSRGPTRVSLRTLFSDYDQLFLIIAPDRLSNEIPKCPQQAFVSRFSVS